MLFPFFDVEYNAEITADLSTGEIPEGYEFAFAVVDHSGKFIQTKYIHSGQKVSEPEDLPDKVGYKHTNSKWINLLDQVQ